MRIPRNPMPNSFLVMLLITSTMMACLGMGNGSVFQIVPQRFKDEIGVMTGIVGAFGGLGDSCCQTIY